MVNRFKAARSRWAARKSSGDEPTPDETAESSPPAEVASYVLDSTDQFAVEQSLVEVVPETTSAEVESRRAAASPSSNDELGAIHGLTLDSDPDLGPDPWGRATQTTAPADRSVTSDEQLNADGSERDASSHEIDETEPADLEPVVESDGLSAEETAGEIASGAVTGGLLASVVGDEESVGSSEEVPSVDTSDPVEVVDLEPEAESDGGSIPSGGSGFEESSRDAETDLFAEETADEIELAGLLSVGEIASDVEGDSSVEPSEEAPLLDTHGRAEVVDLEPVAEFGGSGPQESSSDTTEVDPTTHSSAGEIASRVEGGESPVEVADPEPVAASDDDDASTSADWQVGDDGVEGSESNVEDDGEDDNADRSDDAGNDQSADTRASQSGVGRTGLDLVGLAAQLTRLENALGGPTVDETVDQPVSVDPVEQTGERLPPSVASPAGPTIGGGAVQDELPLPSIEPLPTMSELDALSLDLDAIDSALDGLSLDAAEAAET